MSDPLNESSLVSKALEDGVDLREYLTEINDRLETVLFRFWSDFLRF